MGWCASECELREIERRVSVSDYEVWRWNGT